MMQNRLSITSYFVTFLVATLANGLARAESIRVLKASGNRATVEFQSGQAPAPGQVLLVGQDEARVARASLERTIALAAEISSMNDSQSGSSTTTFAASGRYGWNWGHFEGGPSALFSLTQTSPLATQKITVGGFLDYNFMPNDGQALVYGLGGALRIGTLSTTRQSASFSNGVQELEFGPFVKWFPWSATRLCLRGDLIFASYGITGDQPIATTSSGLRALGGLQYYF
jgi:hypothetical protein